MMSDIVTARERWLVILLRVGGGLLLLAFAAIFLPIEWMEAAHHRLGLGEFPASPLVDYLTRSASALYGIQGGLYFVLAANLRRHRAVVRYFAVMNAVFGVVVTGIDLHAGMPLYWTLVEGPPLVAFGLVMLWLLLSVPETPE